MKDKPFYYQDNRALHEKKMNEAARLEISRRNIEFILSTRRIRQPSLPSTCGDVRAELGHVPAQSEVLGGDLLALRFGSWGNALAYSGFPVSTGPAVSNFSAGTDGAVSKRSTNASPRCTRRRKRPKKRPKPPGASRSRRRKKRKRRRKPREALNESAATGPV